MPIPEDIIVKSTDTVKTWSIGEFAVEFNIEENQWRFLKRGKTSRREWVHDFIIDTHNLIVGGRVQRVQENKIYDK